MDPYELLEVPKNASTEDIRRAYRKKAKSAHPDRAGGSTQVMAALNAAYRVLGDEEKRERFDRTGEDRTGEDRPVQDPLVQARAHLVGRFLQWMQADQRGSLVSAVEQQLRADIGQIRQNHDTQSKGIAKIERLLKKLKFKGRGEDPIRVMIESQIATAKQQAQNSLAQIAVIEAALTLLKLYDWEADPVGAGYAPGGFYITNGSTR